MIPEQYNILWTSSWIPLFPTMEAIKRKQYDLAIGSGAVFLTSINFWNNPINSWRKTLDMWTVRSVFLYQSYKAITNKNYMYFAYSLSAITSYYVGEYYYIHNQSWKSVYCHFALHLLANFGCFFLLNNNLKTIK